LFYRERGTTVIPTLDRRATPAEAVSSGEAKPPAGRLLPTPIRITAPAPSPAHYRTTPRRGALDEQSRAHDNIEKFRF